MTVHEYGGSISRGCRDLDVDEGACVRILDHFQGKAFDLLSLHPFHYKIASRLQKPIGLPFRVVIPGLVGYPGKLHQTGDNIPINLRLDKFQGSRGVHFPAKNLLNKKWKTRASIPVPLAC
jgi:hypothetical protein